MRKIVVGTDFSKPGTDLAMHALRVARLLGAEIVLVHVGTVPEYTKGTYGRHEQEVRTRAEALFDERRRQLEELRRRLSGQGVVVSQAIHTGHPVGALCEAADALEASLVVVGTHVRGRTRRFLLGSVAEGVVRHCRRDVLLGRGAPPAGGFRRILVPVDFGEFSDRALDTALTMASKDAEIKLLHCWHLPFGIVDDWGGGQSEFITEIRNGIREENGQKLHALILRHRRPGVLITYDQLGDSARDGILRSIDSHNYDLVVMGSHGRDRISSYFVGSTAIATVRHAPCSVLVVKQLMI